MDCCCLGSLDVGGCLKSTAALNEAVPASSNNTTVTPPPDRDGPTSDTRHDHDDNVGSGAGVLAGSGYVGGGCVMGTDHNNGSIILSFRPVSTAADDHTAGRTLRCLICW
ncbi:hypothetical protein BaRGS_00037948 [Batillaria attramentaria]|uniref:Uncharacterized protein n=1 Tax=Batillaria attramentaria TaxID=370345 RepID=A0ABD0J774_9CAEN